MQCDDIICMVFKTNVKQFPYSYADVKYYHNYISLYMSLYLYVYLCNVMISYVWYLKLNVNHFPFLYADVEYYHNYISDTAMYETMQFILMSLYLCLYSI